jgi:hypothetical protein
MADVLVLLPLGPGEFLALTPADLAQARDRAREVLGPGPAGDRGTPATTHEPLLTASEISTATGIPAPWYLESARRREIPHVRLGRYPRFQLSKVVEHGLVTPPAEPGSQWGRKAKRAGGAP